jgi:NADP-dependent 3-hydroxy acid dehydrogenase YdfG
MTHQIALITGASGGIGRAVALSFAQAGIELLLVSRSIEKLQAVQQEVTALGGKAQIYALDLSLVGQVQKEIAAIVEQIGKIDILVNNAGMGYTGSIADTSLEDWQQVIDLNLTSAFQCMQGVLPLMRQQHQGTIVNIASIAAKQFFPGWGAYSVSKAGLVALSQTLAIEEPDLRVITICPGAVNTDIWDSATVKVSLNRAAMLTPEAVAQTVLHTVSLPPGAVITELTLMPNAGVL